MLYSPGDSCLENRWHILGEHTRAPSGSISADRRTQAREKKKSRKVREREREREKIFPPSRRSNRRGKNNLPFTLVLIEEWVLSCFCLRCERIVTLRVRVRVQSKNNLTYIRRIQIKLLCSTLASSATDRLSKWNESNSRERKEICNFLYSEMRNLSCRRVSCYLFQNRNTLQGSAFKRKKEAQITKYKEREVDCIQL